MTTKTEIKLPPLPTFEQAESACKKGEDGPLERFIYENEPADTEATVDRWRESIRAVMYAAVEADRQRRGEPTAAEISDVIREITGCPDIKNGEDSLVVALGMLFHRGATTQSAEPVKVPSDLANRLRIKAGMITMGEKIAWGSDVDLMLQAAQALEDYSQPSPPAASAEPDNMPPLDARAMLRGDDPISEIEWQPTPR